MPVSSPSLRILCPNGHLGFAPIKTASFQIGLERAPDLICADSGSCDVGPGPLGADVSSSPLQWQGHDLEHMLLAARRLGVPMIVGSAGDTGSNSGVDRFGGIVKDLACDHRLTRFRIGYFYSEVDKDYLRRKITAGDPIDGLDGRPPLDLATLGATDRVVAMAGVHPYIELLDWGADVIIGGRSGDCAIFAAPAIRKGLPEGLAYFAGKVLECASFCAEPYAGKESVLGEITMEDFKVTALWPEQRCTPASVAAHTMYERPNTSSAATLRCGSAATSNMTSAPLASPGRNTFRRRSCAPSSKAPASSASGMSAWSVCATPTRSRISMR
jgi:Acyclic terpene utilisation family protein AtuA